MTRRKQAGGRSKKSAKSPGKSVTDTKSKKQGTTPAVTPSEPPTETDSGGSVRDMAPLPPTISKKVKEKGAVSVQSVEVTAPDEVRKHDESVLFFTPYAWAKLKFMCHMVSTEIGGMGISSPEDPLLIEDIRIIKQSVSQASVSFDPEAYADFCLEMCDPDGEYKLKPVNCQRVWIHTHPENMSFPSSIDEENFRDGFGCADWAVMFIMPRAGDLYVRMRASVGGMTIISYPDVELAWHKPFPASDHDAWLKEIQDNVSEEVWLSYRSPRGGTWEDGVTAYPSPRTNRRYTSTAVDDDIFGELGFGFENGIGDEDVGFTPHWWESESTTDPIRRHSTTQSGHTKPKTKPKGSPSLRVPKSSILYMVEADYLPKLVRQPIKISDLTEKMIADLEGATIHLVGDDEEGNAIFQCVDGDEVEHKCTSDKLLFVRRYRSEQPACLQDLEDAEKDLKALAGDRDLGEEDLYDIHNQPIELIYPWTCLDGTKLFLSQAEWDLLDDIRDGRMTIDDVYENSYGNNGGDSGTSDVPSALYSKSDLSVGQEVLVLERGKPQLAEVTSMPPNGNKVQITILLENGNKMVSMIRPEDIIEIVTPSQEDQEAEGWSNYYSPSDIDVGDIVTVTLDDRRNPEDFISGEACSVNQRGVMVEFQMEDGSRQVANIPYSHVVNVEDPPIDDDEDDDDDVQSSFLSPEVENLQTGFFTEDGSFASLRHERAWKLVWPILQEAISNGETVESIEERLDKARKQAIIDGDWQEFDEIIEAAGECGYSLEGLQRFMEFQLQLERREESTAYDASEALQKGDAV